MLAVVTRGQTWSGPTSSCKTLFVCVLTCGYMHHHHPPHPTKGMCTVVGAVSGHQASDYSCTAERATSEHGSGGQPGRPRLVSCTYTATEAQATRLRQGWEGIQSTSVLYLCSCSGLFLVDTNSCGVKSGEICLIVFEDSASYWHCPCWNLLFVYRADLWT